MVQINRCKKCNSIMIKQMGWVGENMIEYEVCTRCKHIEILSEGLTIKEIKEIELQKGYK